MPLVLSVLRCPEQAVPEQRRVPGGEYVLGRGAECDWALRDPDRVLSKRHCAVEFLSGAWQVRDLSTNGTFVNGAGEPLGRDQVRVLRDGDRLRLGAYEIECRVEEEASYGSGRWQSANAIPDPMAPPPVSDIFSAPLPGLSPAGGPPQGNAPLLPADFDPFAPEDQGPVMPDHRPSTNDVFTPPRAMMPDLLPSDWDGPGAGKPTPAAPDPFAHLPDPFADAPPSGARRPDPFTDPGMPAPATRLPDPFADLGTPAPAAPAAKLPDPFADFGMPAPAAPAAKLPDPFADLGMPAPAAPAAKLPDPFADLGMPAPAAPAAKLPDPFADLGTPAPAAPTAKLPDPFADLGMPAPAAPTAKLPDPFADLGMPAPAAPAARLPDPFADLGMPAPTAPAAKLPHPVPPPAAEPPPLMPAATLVSRSALPDPFAEANYPSVPPPSLAQPQAAAPPPMASPASSADGLHAALALIHEAAGLGPPIPGTDAAAALAAVGASMRAAVAGMRGLLIARADVKREFRIEQTMLRAAGNNPVKFAATDEAAVLALLGPKGNGPAALRETVQDLTAHQVATVAATQAAAKALLARLAPAGLEAEIPAGGIMPGAREKKLWEAYRKLHQQVTDQFEDDFDSAFGKAFARAYEDAARGGR
ncbi:type VI secretion system-associated FHA domain protein TagH [Sediminicoccus sp. KRV36]|uniref:type VI secretion system-associated FHA domain protein TagH n=1 Tax=Sediminicoccus sp. KRV36 TaxID=3133721 RepID=UPI0020101CD3|nr:type VI secretion system-associated FHA domain protein TagH [Sediminicoccus rosea]UPY37739.1 type VI secretion system-associated FHA domain protein TagH [Sediminicoccus rosea]